jgi:hypothetical protein
MIKRLTKIIQFSIQKTNSVFTLYINRETEKFIESYHLAYNEEPSQLRISKFRKDHVMKIGLVSFGLLTTLFFFTT